MPRPDATEWRVESDEHARLTPEGPTAAVVESRAELPLRVRQADARGRPHPGSAVVLGKATFEVVAIERQDGAVLYRLEHWQRENLVRDRVVYGPRLVRAARTERRRARVDHVVGPVRWLLGMAAGLLPGPERQPLVGRFGLDAVRGSVLLAVIQVLAGGILWPAGLIQYAQHELERGKGAFWDDKKDVWREDADTQTKGVQVMAEYATRPLSLFLVYCLLTGVVRYLHVRTSDQPLPDPVLALGLGALRRLRTRSRDKKRLEELGPERPDRVMPEGEDLVVICAREKPEWSERATIQVGETLYRVRDAADRPDGQWTAIGYRLTPIEAGRIVRGIISYEPPDARRPWPRPAGVQPVAAGPQPESMPAPPALRTSPPPAGLPAEAPVADVPGGRPAEAGRTRWRIDEGEQARLTPEGPTAAVVESQGSLPLRVRSEAMGVHHRPEFPGSCVLLGGERYEVVAEEVVETGFRYHLEPWRMDAIARHVVEYGPRLVRAAQRERRGAEERAERDRYAPLLYPLIGLLPEERQLAACDSYGLEPRLATLAGVLLELAVVLTAAAAHGSRFAAGGILQGLKLAPFAILVGMALVFPAVMRLIGVAFGQVAGNWIVELVVGWGAERGHRQDATVIPLTREAFWARLNLPDRHERPPDGSLTVKGLLPHLRWTSRSALRTLLEVEGEHWSITALPPAIEKGRLTYAYHLFPARDPGMRADLPDPSPPDPRHYQWEVLEEVSREWDDVFRAAPWLPALLPRGVQERAYRGRGAAAQARRWSLITACLTLAAGLWIVTGSGPVNFLLGLLLLGDGGHRLWRAQSGDFAPSAFGGLFAHLLRPERVAYHAHRDAERETLTELKAGR